MSSHLHLASSIYAALGREGNLDELRHSNKVRRRQWKTMVDLYKLALSSCPTRNEHMNVYNRRIIELLNGTVNKGDGLQQF